MLCPYIGPNFFGPVWTSPNSFGLDKKCVFTTEFCHLDRCPKHYGLVEVQNSFESVEGQGIFLIPNCKAIETGMILSIMDMKKKLLCVFFIDLYSPR